jgi:hypothetical protein
MQNIFVAFTSAEILQHRLHSYAEATNCRLSVADGSVDGDAIFRCVGHSKNIALSLTRKKPVADADAKPLRN